MLSSGTWEQFQNLRDFLRSRFSEEIVSAALGVPRIRDFDKRDPRSPIRDPLVRFLFAGAAVPIVELHRAIPAPALDAMGRLGLIAQSGDHVWCPFILYPTYGLHLLSDRFMNPDGTPRAGEREFVYFALTPNTQTYLDMLPEHGCEAFLDVGAGCGAAALTQARVARCSVAADISPRSTSFAQFNARLNDLSNAECVTGSLYEPTGSRMFDRIGCHPPYDLSSTSPWTFADGGDDGEFVIRGTIAGLPDHLAPGGEFYALFRGGDREAAPLEHRVREWLGERHAEFDIALAVRGIVRVEDYAISSILSTTHDFHLYESYLERFAALQVRQLVYSNLLVRRRRTAGPPLTIRRDAGARCTFVELGWLLDWERIAPQFDLAGTFLVASPDMEMLVRHRALHGDLRPTDYRLVARTPFPCEMDCPEWVALVVARCAVPKPAEQVYQETREQTPVSPDQFSAAVKRLISAGVLQVASGSRMTSSS